MRKMDPTIPYMVLDVVRETLAASNDISTLKKKITSLIREITGARVVVFITFLSDKNNSHHSFVDPGRYEDQFTPALQGKFLETWRDLDKLTLIQPDDTGKTIRDFLQENRFEKNLICPLIARDRKEGILLVFGIIDINIIKMIRQIFEVLFDTVALILENSKLMRDQKETIEARTKELKSALVAAEAANHAKSEFLANMSHEIRTSMNAILGFSEILQQKETDPQKLHFAGSIHRSGSALLALINDILDLSKIESGKMELQYSAISLSSLCNELNILFSQDIDNRGLVFEIVVNENIPQFIVCDESRLRQVFINLLANAVKFTKSGFVKLTVTCQFPEGSSRSRVNLIFTVSDSGIGVPADQQDKIFVPFEQVKWQKESEYGGTGLGLAITRRIIEQMQGTISVESEVGVGTTFTIFIPYIEIAAEVDVSQSRHTIDTSAITFAPATILIADDIDYNREIVSTYLSDWEFTIHLTGDGKEALEKAREVVPDIILLDMKMPVMNGYEASRLMKEDASLEKVTVIAVTASALKQDEEVISKLCNGYLRKPVSRTNLIQELMKHLPHTIKEIEREVPLEETLPAEIIFTPHDQTKKLLEATKKGSITDLKSAILEVREMDLKYHPFADRVEALTCKYQFEEIIQLLQQHIMK